VAAAFRLLGLILLICLGEAQARAAPTPQESAQARDAFKSAQVHYDLKEYAAALEDFKNSYRLVQDPVMLFNIAQCHYFLGQNEEALGFYRNFLRRLPDAPNRGAVERKIQDIEHKLAAAPKPAAPAGVVPPKPGAASLSPPPAEPVAGGTAAGGIGVASGAAAPLSPPSPLPQAGAGDPGGAGRQDGTSLSALTSAPPLAPAASPAIWKRWWFWTGIGVVVAGGVLAGIAISQRGQVGDCMGQPVCLKVGGQ
jgi:tetratricopeptide (TPR) repeat protein